MESAQHDFLRCIIHGLGIISKSNITIIIIFFFANWIHDNYLTQIEFICCCLWFTMHWWGFIAVVVQCIVRWCDSEACKTYTHKTAGNNQNKIYQHQLNIMRKSLLRANGLMSKYIECTFNLRAPSTKFFSLHWNSCWLCVKSNASHRMAFSQNIRLN